MNTTLKMKLASCLFSVMVGLAALIPGTLKAEGAQKEYTLFEGANISVNLADKIYPLRDVNGSSWVVIVDGQEKVISAAVTPVNLKDRSLPQADGGIGHDLGAQARARLHLQQRPDRQDDAGPRQCGLHFRELPGRRKPGKCR
jgi:hypothetical protein